MLAANAKPFRLEEATIDELHEAIRAGRTSCAAVVRHYIERARAYNGVASALVTEDGARIPEVTGIARAMSPLRFPTETTARRARPGHGGDPAMSGRSFLFDVARGRRRIRVFEAGDGPPLVFLHGAGGLVEESPFLAALGRRWHVFAPLLPGYGDSEGGDTLPDMLAITLHSFDVIEALGLARPYLVGHSMGGMIAAEMAAVAPHDVERLGLIAPAGLWLEDHPIPDLFATLPHELPELLFHDPALGEWLMAPDGDLDNPKFLEAFMIRNARQLTMASILLFPVPDRGLAERVYRIRARTVIVWGKHDRMIPPAYGEAFRRRVAGSELVMVPAAGHMVIIEKTEDVVAALARLD